MVIYMNARMEEIGYLQNYKFDLAFGREENDFVLTVPISTHCCSPGYYLYVDDTEYGGIIDTVSVDTEDGEVSYYGRTWHGLLDSKVIQPPIGEDYLVLSGDIHAVIADLIDRLDLSELFAAETMTSGMVVSNYRFPRYITGYTGLLRLLDTVDGKLHITFVDGTVRLSALQRYKPVYDDDLDSDRIGMTAKKHANRVNHLICLGRGELQNREVLHLYIGPDGHISQTQYYTGLQERTDVYDFPTAESLDDLRDGGIARLNELAQTDELEIDLPEDADVYDIQDVISAKERNTGLSVIAEVTKKIVTIKNGDITISYELGGANG